MKHCVCKSLLWHLRQSLSHTLPKLVLLKLFPPLNEIPKVVGKTKTLYDNVKDLVQVASEPEVVYPLAFDDTLYTLVMVDPDSPSRDNPVRR